MFMNKKWHENTYFSVDVIVNDERDQLGQVVKIAVCLLLELL